MLIITDVSATSLARGYYLWGPPTKSSWAKDEAGYRPFSEYIVRKKFSIGGTSVAVRLEKNTIVLSSFKKDNPSETASLELRPTWQLARVPDDVQSSITREKVSQPHAAKEGNNAKSHPPAVPGGANMEERYRACKKLVKGFSQREACARTGVI